MKGLWLSLGCLLCACASTQEAPPVQSSQSISRTDLGPRTLNPGECGLFVWTRSAPRRFVVFSQTSTDSAVWHDGATEMTFLLIEASGNVAFDQSPQQRLGRADGTILTLDMRQPEQITQGVRYKSGVLTVKKPEAWEQVIPVVGFASCQPVLP